MADPKPTDPNSWETATKLIRGGIHRSSFGETAEALYLTLKTGARPGAGLSAERRQRLKRMLRALDGRQVGASYREIAEQILDMNVADVPAWRTSSARDVAIRLCRGAARLMRGGYLALLRRRP